ncbi:hypothetical protein ACVIGB_005229 [Bradyrhizobium sp. USDA 4341]
MSDVIYADFAGAKSTCTKSNYTKSTYTMTVANDAGEEEVVARGVALSQALTIAIEHDCAGKAMVIGQNVGRGRCFSIGRRLLGDGGFECLRFVFVPSPPFSELDEERAMRIFERKLLDNTGVFWRGRVETDAEYARRRSYG